MRKNPPGTEQWKKLYNLADTISELEPWKVLPEHSIFGVRLPDDGINGYVGIIGELGQVCGVTVYMGESALDRIRYINSAEGLLEIPMLALSFDSPEIVEEGDQKIINSLKRTYKADNTIPVFRTYTPGYFPWYMEKEEAGQLITCLEQTIEVIRRKEFRHLLDIRTEDSRCLYRIPEKNGQWTDIVEEIPEKPEESKHFHIKTSLLRNVGKLPEVTESIQAGLFILPSAIGQEGERPSTAYLLLLVDPDSKMVLGFELLSPIPSIRDMELSVPNFLLRKLEEIGVKPAKLSVDGDGRLCEILYQLGYENLPVHVEEEKELAALETVQYSLFGHMGDDDNELPQHPAKKQKHEKPEAGQTQDDRIHVIKVSLIHDKTVYRKIAIKGNQTLEDLHGAIYNAFDREEEHLYSFFFPDKPTKSQRTIMDSLEYTITGMADDLFDKEQNDASEATIQSLKLRMKQKFYYLFDWGDEWWHELTYEGVKEIRAEDLPAVIVAKGESPPQYPDYDEED
ncbi:MAG: hypothetical protein GQ565_07060 [Candidatus Aegiribacteria sp.]|nr:hypothetical protein [Candidatus Aegiribacteria sp.]